MAGENLLAYYAQRAHECEQVYEKPERQPDLHQIRIWLRDALAGHRILEVACGTGYWTEAVAPVAAAITATDARPEELKMARRKAYPGGRVQLALEALLAPYADELTIVELTHYWTVRYRVASAA